MIAAKINTSPVTQGHVHAHYIVSLKVCRKVRAGSGQGQSLNFCEVKL